MHLPFWADNPIPFFRIPLRPLRRPSSADNSNDRAFRLPLAHQTCRSDTHTASTVAELRAQSRSGPRSVSLARSVFGSFSSLYKRLAFSHSSCLHHLAFYHSVHGACFLVSAHIYNHPVINQTRTHCILVFPCTSIVMPQSLRRRLFADREQEEPPARPTKKQKRNPPDLKTRVLNRQFRMSLFGNTKFNTHLAVPAFFGGKNTKRDAPAPSDPNQSNSRDVDLDLELSFASTMSLNSPARDHQPLTPEDENPDHVPMDISPAPAPHFQAPQPLPVTSNHKPIIGRPRAATSAARLFGRDMSNGSEFSSQYSALSSSKSGTNSSSAKRLQRAALPTEWLAPAARVDENAFSQVSGLRFLGWRPD